MTELATPKPRRERDAFGDTLPLVAASIVAWWTTVRPAAFAPNSTWRDAWLVRGAAVAAALGVIAAVTVVARRWRGFVPVVLGGFVLPCAAVWMLGPESATALSEPLEVLLGGIAWTAVGIVLMRPQAVAAPRGAEGGRGPTIGAQDDAARVAMKEVESDLVDEPPPRLSPRKPQPRLAAVPLVVSGIVSALVGWQVMRVAPTAPDRAVLARIVGAACAIALLSTGGDLVEARYLTRRAAKPKTRLSRAAVAVAIGLLLGFIGFVLAGREG